MNERLQSAALDRLPDLSPAELEQMRLATQVLAHKAALTGRPLVERYWRDLGRAVAFALARRGIGFVVGRPPRVALDDGAEPADRAMLAEHLGLLAGNAQLPPAVRELCAALIGEASE